jgi:monoamine oxidase
MRALTDALARVLPDDRIVTGRPVTGLASTSSGIMATLADGTRLRARQVVLALPPRIAATLTFSPALPAAARDAMAATPTWMAGQAKAVLLYDCPFWRDAGLSGDAMSHRGPMVEIHDASPACGGPPALFGFIGLPGAQRMDAASLRAGVAAQAARLFGPDAPAPREILLKDWACDPATAVPADADPLTAHPRYGLPQALRILWDGALLLANTEVAAEFGGYLEGALVAAETAYGAIALRARSA